MVTGRSRGGFTLIELTLAMVLLAVGLLALVGALVRALDEAQSARLRHVALRQAESVADSIAAAAAVSAGSTRFGPVRVEWRPEACAAGSCVRLVSTMQGHPRDTVELLVRTPRSAGRP